MKRETTLDLLIELERRERDRVAQVTAQARRESDAAGSTLQMLRGYRLDYDARSPKRGSQDFTTTKVQVHEHFVQRLDRAIDDQHALAGRLDAATQEREAQLLERQRRLKALETLSLRRETLARLAERRSDQRQTDEFAIQAFLRSHGRGHR